MLLYFAGPLFCNAEKEFNEKLTANTQSHVEQHCLCQGCAQKDLQIRLQ